VVSSPDGSDITPKLKDTIEDFVREQGCFYSKENVTAKQENPRISVRIAKKL
jgi:hypothetical protein